MGRDYASRKLPIHFFQSIRPHASSVATKVNLHRFVRFSAKSDRTVKSAEAPSFLSLQGGRVANILFHIRVYG
jgi:hypothetical protein